MKKILVNIWMIIPLMIAAGCSPVVFLSVSQRFEKEGDELVQADRVSEAALAYHQAVTADSQNWSAIQKLAPIYANQGRTRTAIEMASRIPDKKTVPSGLAVTPANPQSMQSLQFSWITSPEKDTPVGIAADAEMVAVAYQKGFVSALRSQNGEILWSQLLAENITSPPAISTNVVLVGCESGKVMALDRTDGTLHWEVQLSGAIFGEILDIGDTAYIGSFNGGMSSIQLADGKIRWQLDAESPILAGALLEANTLYFGTSNGSVFSVDAETGKLLWQKPVRLSGGIESIPVLAGNRLLVGTNDSRMYALDLNGKDYFWAYSTPDSIYASPLVNDNLVFIFSIGQSAAAVDLSTGNRIWQSDVPAAVRTTPVLHNDAIYFAGTTTPFLYVLDAGTGEAISQSDTGDWIEFGPVISGDYLLLAGKDGAVLAYQFTQN